MKKHARDGSPQIVYYEQGVGAGNLMDRIGGGAFGKGTGTQRSTFWGIRPMVRHPFEPPPGVIGQKGPSGIDIFTGKDG